MRKKILLLSDDMRMTSGIATMSKELVMGTLHKFDYFQVGAAISHPEFGKTIIIDEDAKKISGDPNAKLKIFANNGYGDINLLRKILEEEKPDVIVHFTDPHYWQWLYDNEHEIRQQIPVLFYHIWDDLPDPQYNRNYYESCDWIGCISRQTYGIVNRVGKRNDINTFNPLKDWQISYVPHGINSETFKPLEIISSEVYNEIHDKKYYDFILFYNNRNIRRKQPADVIYSFKMFCDLLPKEKSNKCLLLMNTSAIDENGTDLLAVKKDLCPDYDVKFITQKLTQEKLNEYYNLVDCTINIANNEGFGLTTMESLMAGTPIIVNVTGGLQDQCGFKLDGKEFTAEDYVSIGSLHRKSVWENKLTWGDWVTPIWSVSQLLNGSVPTPYIFDDRVSHDDVVNAIFKNYMLGRDKRKENGLKGRNWALNNFSSKIMCEKFIEGIENTLKNFEPKKRYELYKIV